MLDPYKVDTLCVDFKKRIELLEKMNNTLVERLNDSDREMGYLRHLIDHSNIGIEKCFVRIERLEKDVKGCTQIFNKIADILE